MASGLPTESLRRRDQQRQATSTSTAAKTSPRASVSQGGGNLPSYRKILGGREKIVWFSNMRQLVQDVGIGRKFVWKPWNSDATQSRDRGETRPVGSDTSLPQSQQDASAIEIGGSQPLLPGLMLILNEL